MQQAPRPACPSKNILSSDATRADKLTFYPAYTFKASATWFKWVKLTAHDIHSVLKPHDKYAADITTASSSAFGPSGRSEYHGASGGGHGDNAGLLLFYLNHPIQFVQVIGVVVVLEEYFEKFWLFTVDDGSGATIDVMCRKPEKEKEKVHDVIQPGQSREYGQGHDMAKPNLHGSNQEKDSRHSVIGATSSNVGNEDTTNNTELTELQLLHQTLSGVQIGTVVQAKGTISTFRSTRQLALLRLSILPDTTHEMALISSRTAFLKSTLAKPWTLSLDDQEKLLREAQDDRQDGRQRAAKRREREVKMQERERRHARFIREQYETEEKKRAKAARQARKAGVALQEAQESRRAADEALQERVTEKSSSQ